MRWATFALAIAMLGADNPGSLKTDLVVLTRDECVNTPDVLFNVKDALKTLGWPQDFQFVNIVTLPASDVRTAYPTPTLLWKGKDIVGMPVPKPPHDVPG